ncbi:hypothetical protein ABDK96_03765 [Citricoccus nitrophenolicus]|uniref:Uncharacterized protein n=1 Tax=Citricoccus nitrophenolicus TaxID=863575 RepID=A0ABV0IF63_9MICC
MAATLRESMASGESEAAIKSNLRDSVDELEHVLLRLEASK